VGEGKTGGLAASTHFLAFVITAGYLAIVPSLQSTHFERDIGESGSLEITRNPFALAA
jgi:hypothetical protein